MQWKMTFLRVLTEKLLQIEFKNTIISTMQNYIIRVISVLDLASKTFISVLFCLFLIRLRNCEQEWDSCHLHFAIYKSELINYSLYILRQLVVLRYLGESHSVPSCLSRNICLLFCNSQSYEDTTVETNFSSSSCLSNPYFLSFHKMLM